MRKEDEKLAELILYISDRNALNSKFGKTKLCKTLFYSDFHAYYNWQESITGQEYLKLEHGPFPKRFEKVLKAMLKAGLVAITVISFPKGELHRISPMRTADLTKFSATEIALVDQEILRLWEHSANQVSDLSHEFIGWKQTKTSNVIPYDSIYICSPDDVIISERARKNVKKFAEQC